MNYIPNESRYKTMRYNRSGLSGLKLPAVSLGLWHNFGGVDTFSNSRAMVLRAFDLGITHLDLANNYGPPPGSAEETFGQIIATEKAQGNMLIEVPAIDTGLIHTRDMFGSTGKGWKQFSLNCGARYYGVDGLKVKQ